MAIDVNCKAPSKKPVTNASLEATKNGMVGDLSAALSLALSKHKVKVVNHSGVYLTMVLPTGAKSNELSEIQRIAEHSIKSFTDAKGSLVDQSTSFGNAAQAATSNGTVGFRIPLKGEADGCTAAHFFSAYFEGSRPVPSAPLSGANLVANERVLGALKALDGEAKVEKGQTASAGHWEFGGSGVFIEVSGNYFSAEPNSALCKLATAFRKGGKLPPELKRFVDAVILKIKSMGAQKVELVSTRDAGIWGSTVAPEITLRVDGVTVPIEFT